MSLVHRVFRTILAFSIFASSALADVPEELRDFVLTGDMNARSSVDFRSRANNVSAFVPKGTHGTVLEVRKLSKTGNFGLKVKVTSVGKTGASNAVKQDQEVWVYYSKNNPWLSFKDKDKQTVQDPESALTTQAKRDGEALPAIEGTVKKPTLPSKKEILKLTVDPDSDPNLVMKDRSETEGAWCAPCKLGVIRTPEQVNQEQVEEMAARFNKELGKKSEPTAPKIVAKDVPKTSKWADDPLVPKYSNSKSTQAMIDYAKRNCFKHSKSQCYKKVKYALVAKKGMRYPPGGSARHAVRDLKAQGWINLMDDPRYKGKIKSPADVPKGAVMVSWTGENYEHGDVQIKTDWTENGGGWASDFCSPRPIQEQTKGRRKAREGHPYKIIGVMIQK